MAHHQEHRGKGTEKGQNRSPLLHVKTANLTESVVVEKQVSVLTNNCVSEAQKGESFVCRTEVIISFSQIFFVKSTQYTERTSYSPGTREHQQNYSAGADDSNHERVLCAFYTVPTELSQTKSPQLVFLQKENVHPWESRFRFPKGTQKGPSHTT